MKIGAGGTWWWWHVRKMPQRNAGSAVCHMIALANTAGGKESMAEHANNEKTKVIILVCQKLFKRLHLN